MKFPFVSALWTLNLFSLNQKESRTQGFFSFFLGGGLTPFIQDGNLQWKHHRKSWLLPVWISNFSWNSAMLSLLWNQATKKLPRRSDSLPWIWSEIKAEYTVKYMLIDIVQCIAYLSIYQSIYLSDLVHIYLSISVFSYLSIYLSQSFISIYLSIYLSISFCSYIYTYIYYIYIYIYIYIYNILYMILFISICRSISVFSYLSLSLNIYIYIYIYLILFISCWQP